MRGEEQPGDHASCAGPAAQAGQGRPLAGEQHRQQRGRAGRVAPERDAPATGAATSAVSGPESETPTTATAMSADVPAARPVQRPGRRRRWPAHAGHADAAARDRDDGAVHGRRHGRAARDAVTVQVSTDGRPELLALPDDVATTSRRRRAARSATSQTPVPSAAEPVAGSSSQRRSPANTRAYAVDVAASQDEHRDALAHAERRRARRGSGSGPVDRARRAPRGRRRQCRSRPRARARRSTSAGAQPHRGGQRVGVRAVPRASAVPPVSAAPSSSTATVEHAGAALLPQRAGGQPAGADQGVRRADARVPGEGQLGERREDPHPVVGAGLGGRADERGLREVELERERLALLGGQVVGVEHHGQRIARERPRREHVDDLVVQAFPGRARRRR